MDTDLVIAMASSVILASIKNPDKKKKLEKVMFKIWSTIGNSYPQFASQAQTQTQTKPTP